MAIGNKVRNSFEYKEHVSMIQAKSLSNCRCACDSFVTKSLNPVLKRFYLYPNFSA